MGIEWYLLCDHDMTAYNLGKGGSPLADIIYEGKTGDALAAEVRAWVVEGDWTWFEEHVKDVPAYQDRVASEIVAFMQKPNARVRVDNDASWDDVWIDHGRDTSWARANGYKIYRLVGERYVRNDELKPKGSR